MFIRNSLLIFFLNNELDKYNFRLLESLSSKRHRLYEHRRSLVVCWFVPMGGGGGLNPHLQRAKNWEKIVYISKS